MATQWATFPVEMRGGLISNMSLLQQGVNAVGSASILENFEVDKEGGYTKIRGYAKFSTTAVPGTGDILGVKVISSSRVIAARKINTAAVTAYATVTAAVNGAISSATALVLDTNNGTIEVGMTVTGTGISGDVEVTAVADQNNITLSSAQSIANDVVLTFGKLGATDIGKTGYYYSTGSGWTNTNVSSNSNGSKVNHAAYNLDGSDKIIFVDGVSFPSIYDVSGNTQTNLSASSAKINTDVQGSDRVVIFKNTAFYTKDHTLLFTAPYTIDNFSAADGAGTISLSHDITGIAVFRDQLIIFTTDTISRLTGTSSSDFQLQPITEKIGCINGDTVQEIGGDIMYLAPDGLRLLSATDRIGDFALDVASDKIAEDAASFLSGATSYCSAVFREKSQYRIFAYQSSQASTSAKGLIATKKSAQGSAGIEWSTTRGIKVGAIDSVYNSNAETIAFGNSDGFTYIMDTGTTFDGTSVEATLETAFMPIDDPQIRKTFYKAVWFLDPEGTVDIDFNVKFDFDSKTRNNVVQPDKIDITTSGVSVAFFGSVGVSFAASGGSSFGSTLEKIYPTNIIGSGDTIALRISDKSSNPIFTVDTCILEYKTNDRQ